MKDTKRNEGPGLPPGRWEDHFRKAGVRVEDLDGARSAQARATLLGNFLSQNQGREVPIQVGDRSGRARLCLAGGDGKPRRYYVAIAWDDPLESDPSDLSATRPAALDDGLGHPVTEEPGVATPSRRHRPPTARRRPLGREGGTCPRIGEAAANPEDWS